MHPIPKLIIAALAIYCLAGCETLKIKAKFCREVSGTTVCAESDGKSVVISATQK